jgi:hypothetical protein
LRVSFPWNGRPDDVAQQRAGGWRGAGPTRVGVCLQASEQRLAGALLAQQQAQQRLPSGPVEQRAVKLVAQAPELDGVGAQGDLAVAVLVPDREGVRPRGRLPPVLRARAAPATARLIT